MMRSVNEKLMRQTPEGFEMPLAIGPINNNQWKEIGRKR